MPSQAEERHGERVGGEIERERNMQPNDLKNESKRDLERLRG